MENEEETEIPNETEQFVGKDLFQNYMYYRGYLPLNPLEDYNAKRKCIEFGKELLPRYEDEEEQKKIDVLYAEACKVLETEIPKKRKIIFSYQDHGAERFQVYKISADDAKDCQAEREKLDMLIANFSAQQHEQHLGKLQEIDNKIFHELTLVGLISAVDPTLEKMMEDMLKEHFSLDDFEDEKDKKAVAK